MKKISLILILALMFTFMTSCQLLDGFIDLGAGEGSTDGGDNKPGDDLPGNDNPDNPGDNPGGEETPDNPGDNLGGEENPDNPGDNPGGEENPDNPGDNPGGEENPDNPGDNTTAVTVNSYLGLNEQIYLNVTKEDGFAYKVSYKRADETDYTKLDDNLIIESDGELECYVLGIAKGKYDVKIEAENADEHFERVLEGIDVAAQDRSGYAHFGYDDGIGAYNNDGTVKDGAVILYVTNETKNTVTMTIDGTEYVGLVNIMQKLFKCDYPVLIRIIGKITTNQWNYKNVEPRLTDGSNATDDFFVNTFSNEYGENLANLKVRYTDKKDGKTYTYTTTPNGLSEPRVTGSGTSTTYYKGSDFPLLKGKQVYDDDSYINVIEVQAAKNVTIEGVGQGAEIFQFGFGFEECQSIEVKNLTFTSYPEDAINFMVDSDKGVAAFGNYWVHNNTFNAGYNAWDITGERDKFAGDGTIDMAFVHNISIAYNKFDSCKKTMLVGNSDSSRCMNISIHHNHFYSVGSRIPLCRNTNVHSFNNFFEKCSTCSSVRVTSYLFSEANYYKSCTKPFEVSGSAVKSYGDIFDGSPKNSATIATSREQTVSNSCKPDKSTDYSKFDTNPALFYYDSVNGVTIAEHLINAEQVPEFVKTYAGAGVLNKLP